MAKTGFRLQSRGEGDLKTRYRPQRLSEVVPTAPMTRLRQIIAKPSSQVFLFEGLQGSGKTTCARIIARGLICEATEGEKPCLNCEPCLNMERSGDFDERNIGDDRKIDDVRDLTRTMLYEPNVLKRRIVILDEVHNLTAASQECLLKPLEEPKPRMLVFLCTTSTKNLKKTLLERAQRVTFRPLDRESAMEVIRQVCAAEKVDLPDDTTCATLYESSAGSVRQLLNNIQAFIEGGFQPVVVADEEVTDDVKALTHGLINADWAAISEVLRRPSVRASAESVRIGVECYARSMCLRHSSFAPMGMAPTVLKNMVGSLADEPTISQYNNLVLRCMLVCKEIREKRKAK